MPFILVTRVVCQFEISALKASAPLNMPIMLVTLVVIQFEMSSLKVSNAINKLIHIEKVSQIGEIKTYIRNSVDDDFNFNIDGEEKNIDDFCDLLDVFSEDIEKKTLNLKSSKKSKSKKPKKKSFYNDWLSYSTDDLSGSVASGSVVVRTFVHNHYGHYLINGSIKIPVMNQSMMKGARYFLKQGDTWTFAKPNEISKYYSDFKIEEHKVFVKEIGRKNNIDL